MIEMTVLPRFAPLLKSVSPYIKVTGPRRSGKTVFCCQYAVNYALMNPGSNIQFFGMFSEVKNTFRITAEMPGIQKYLNVCNLRLGHIGFKNGSNIIMHPWDCMNRDFLHRLPDVVIVDSCSYQLEDKYQRILLDMYDWAEFTSKSFITVYSEDTDEIQDT